MVFAPKDRDGVHSLFLSQPICYSRLELAFEESPPWLDGWGEGVQRGVNPLVAPSKSIPVAMIIVIIIADKGGLAQPPSRRIRDAASAKKSGNKTPGKIPKAGWLVKHTCPGTVLSHWPGPTRRPDAPNMADNTNLSSIGRKVGNGTACSLFDAQNRSIRAHYRLQPLIGSGGRWRRGPRQAQGARDPDEDPTLRQSDIFFIPQFLTLLLAHPFPACTPTSWRLAGMYVPSSPKEKANDAKP